MGKIFSLTAHPLLKGDALQWNWKKSLIVQASELSHTNKKRILLRQLFWDKFSVLVIYTVIESVLA